VEYSFPYGDSVLRVALPEGLNVTVARPTPMEPVLSARVAFREALAKPLGAPPLSQVVRGKHDCLIVTTDHTRQNCYKLWLPELLDQLNAVGLPDKAIGIFVASAMRGPMTADEKLVYFGEEVLRRVKIHDHDCTSPDLVKAGRTDFGTVLHVNAQVYKAETLILTGGIRYHNFAGYTGGREGILPGSCGLDTINSNFKRAVEASTGKLLDGVRPGQLTGNPFSDDMHEACTLIKPSYYIDVITNDDGTVAWFGAGDFGYVPRLGAKFYDEHNRIVLEQPADVALIGAGGGRSGSTLYRAHKSLRQAERVLAPESHLVWVASCERGEGPDQLAEWRELSLDEIRHRCLRQGTLIGLAALVIKEITAAHKVHIVSTLPEEVCRAWGFIPHATIEQALTAAVPQFPERARWLVGEDMSDLLAELLQAQAKVAGA
jgi:lactate racemase